MKICSSGPADRFAEIIHRLIQRDGGPGNFARLRVHVNKPPSASVFQRWQRLRNHLPIMQAGWRQGIRGPRWDYHKQRPKCPITLSVTDGAPTSLALHWDHRLCDVRAAMQVFHAVADDAALDEMLHAHHHKRYPDCLPSDLAGCGLLARTMPKLTHEFRHGEHWQPHRCAGAGLFPLAIGQQIVGGKRWDELRQYQRTVSGRFGESPFYLAALARALYRVAGARGRLIFPLAVDIRPQNQRWALINGHGFMFASVDAAMAHYDLDEAVAAIKRQQKQWIKDEGAAASLAAMRFAPWLPFTLLRRELGFNKAGLGASAVCGWSGNNVLPSTLGGAPVLGVDHAVIPPAAPGLAVLMHIDGRGLVLDALASAAVAPRCPPQVLLKAMVHGITHG